MRIISALMLVVLVSGTALPQQPAPAPSPSPQTARPAPSPTQAPPIPEDETDVVRIRTNLVQVDAVVVDKAGNQVRDLTADDFEIFEDGKKQVITNFSYISNISPAAMTPVAPVKKRLPSVPAAIRPEDTRRIIALVVDDLGISNESVGPVKKQLRSFIDTQMQPNDLVAIVRTGGEMGALQQFTTDKRLLHRAVDRLRRHQCSRKGWSVVLPTGTLPSTEISLCARGTEGLSARALSFVVQGLGELPGRKAMVVFSDSMPLTYLSLTDTNEPRGGGDGVGREPPAATNDPSPGLSLESALMRIAERAIRASVVIYAIDTTGIQPGGISAADTFPSAGGPGAGVTPAQLVTARSHELHDSRGGGDLMARETGGFQVRNSNDFQLPRVMKDQEGYYLIGYRPTEETFNRRYHHIKARVKRPGIAVRTREGFFGVTDVEAKSTRTNRERINLALLSPFAAADIELELTALFANTPANGNELHSLLYFQAGDLTFTEEPDGWRQAVFDLSGVIFGDNGTVAHQISETRTLRLRREAYEDVLRRGLVYRLILPVPKPGSYQFRVALRDSGTSRLGSAGQFVEVPNLKNNKLALSGITVSGYLDPNEASGQPSTVTRTERDAMSGPSRRKFQTPANLYYGYIIYNPQLDKTTQQVKLMTTMRIIREGRVVFEGQPTPVDLTGQTDLQRVIAGSGVQLGTEMTPGDYILQVTVTDLLAREKQATETQWIDFEIVK